MDNAMFLNLLAIFLAMLDFALASVEIVQDGPVISLHDTSPGLRLRASGFDVVEAGITLKLTAVDKNLGDVDAPFSLISGKDFMISKEIDGLSITLLQGKRYDNKL
jgi:hypothetical protein